MRNLLESIVRILGGESPDALKFVGTGMLVGPECVLTCKHVLRQPDLSGRPTGPVWPYLCVESMTGQRVAVRPEENVLAPTWDLALLTLVASLPSPIPPFLWNLTAAVEDKLRAVPLVVVGYTQVECTQLAQHSINGLWLLPSYRAPLRTLTQFQLMGGLPAGLSGSPVLADIGGWWTYVGTVYLGSEVAATSRVITANPVVEFLGTTDLSYLEGVEAHRVLDHPGTGPLWGVMNLLRASQESPTPYRHLEAFRECDAPYFYGRDVYIAQLLAAIHQDPPQPFIALVGASGSGKSSLVLAGVVPRLRDDPRWQIALCRPGDKPFHAVATALTLLLSPERNGPQAQEPERPLASEPTTHQQSLMDLVAAWATAHSVQRLLLIVDQFEEIYTHPLPEELRHRFFEGLLGLVAGAYPCTVLLTLRADFLGRALEYKPLCDVLQTYPPQLLGPMSEPELREAIEKPAQQCQVALEPNLTDRILRDLGPAPGSLPLLQFTLAQLWTRRSREYLTHTAYEAIGGVHEALATHANAVLSRLSSEQQQRLQHLFVQLVHPGGGTDDTRQVATRAQLSDAEWALACQLAEVDARLVVLGHDAQEQPTVEVVHEALIRYWQPLRTWVDQARAFRLWQERLRQDVQEWEHRHHEEGALLRGTRLTEAEEKLHHSGEMLTLAEQEYIRASLLHRDTEQAARAAARQERERLYQRSVQVLVALFTLGLAMLFGTVARMPLSWVFGTFLSLPTVGVDAGLREWLHPGWHGAFGTFVGSAVVLTCLLFFPDRAPLTLRQALALILAGPLWGLSVTAAVSVGFHDTNLQKLAWDTQNIRWGFLITSPFWAVGMAVGTYLGDRLSKPSTCRLARWRARVRGGLGGIVCFSLLSPLVMGALCLPHAPEAAYSGLFLRTWGDALSQCASAWATLLCFYWGKRRYSLPGASDSETPQATRGLQEET